ncbi:class I SAM-dependent methyltransferase [Bradyrhizobium sp. Lot33]
MIPTKSQNLHHQWADYTSIATEYHIYPNYADWLVRALGLVVPCIQSTRVADIGAGSGKLTEMLGELGASGFAIEPNDAMRTEGERLTRAKGFDFTWKKGTAEDTRLDDASVDWVCLGSSLHWADTTRALSEAHRILRPGGSLSVLWDLRDEERDPYFRAIEAIIHEIRPGLGRAPTIIRKLMLDLDQVFERHEFRDCIRLEAAHRRWYTPEDYVRAWRTVRDLAAQTTQDEYNMIMNSIHDLVKAETMVPMNMRTFCFTSRVAS